MQNWRAPYAQKKILKGLQKCITGACKGAQEMQSKSPGLAATQTQKYKNGADRVMLFLRPFCYAKA